MKLFKLTDRVLDKLGFSEYWDEDGDWGMRNLTFKDGARLRVCICDELDDEDYGYSNTPRYRPEWVYYDSNVQIPKKPKRFSDLNFLHELYFVIEDQYPDNLDEFVDKCKSLHMEWGIDQKILKCFRRNTGT